MIRTFSEENKLMIRHIITFLFLHTSLISFSQVRNNLALDFDFAGTWTAYRYIINPDSDSVKINYELIDSIENIVFIRMTAFEKRAYYVRPVSNSLMEKLPRLLIAIDDTDSGYVIMTENRKSGKRDISNVIIYGVDLMMFNAPNQEDNDSAGVWELKRTLPNF